MMTRLECSVPRALLRCDDPDAFAIRLGAGDRFDLEPCARSLIVSPATPARPGAPVLVEFQPETGRTPEVRRWPIDDPEAMRVSSIVGWFATFDAAEQPAAVA